MFRRHFVGTAKNPRVDAVTDFGLRVRSPL